MEVQVDYSLTDLSGQSTSTRGPDLSGQSTSTRGLPPISPTLSTNTVSTIPAYDFPMTTTTIEKPGSRPSYENFFPLPSGKFIPAPSHSSYRNQNYLQSQSQYMYQSPPHYPFYPSNLPSSPSPSHNQFLNDNKHETNNMNYNPRSPYPLIPSSTADQHYENSPLPAKQIPSREDYRKASQKSPQNPDNIPTATPIDRNGVPTRWYLIKALDSEDEYKLNETSPNLMKYRIIDIYTRKEKETEDCFKQRVLKDSVKDIQKECMKVQRSKRRAKYYENHHEIVKEKQKVYGKARVTCEFCNKEMRRDHLKKHQKSQHEQN